MTDVPKQFNVPKVVRQIGQKNNATIYVGKRKYGVVRQERLYFEGYGLVMCAPYDNHFIFDNPSKAYGQWTPVCTCGSPAGIVGSNAYKQDASPTTQEQSSTPGALIVCLSHAQTGKHSDDST